LKIFVNESAIELRNTICVEDYLLLIQQKKPFAISLNGQFLPKIEYASTALKENDHLQIIIPVTGG